MQTRPLGRLSPRCSTSPHLASPPSPSDPVCRRGRRTPRRRNLRRSSKKAPLSRGRKRGSDDLGSASAALC
eukprot:scaffold2522_cov242-Pinguiococcus_pyrenoidosus.AAC.7